MVPQAAEGNQVVDWERDIWTAIECLYSLLVHRQVRFHGISCYISYVQFLTPSSRSSG